ncbi:MAG: hypothetical protein Q9213_005458 [Squamulea squamosa]
MSEAERFLGPILNNSSRSVRGESIIDILANEYFGLSSDEQGQDAEQRQKVINQALTLIGNLHDELCLGKNSVTYQRDQRVTDALLDLVVLEGIYPSLSPGVGVPMERRVKSALKGGLITRKLDQTQSGQAQDQALLAAIIDTLNPIFVSRKGLASNIEARSLVDMIGAMGELAFSPAFATESRRSQLSLLPLRPDGVKQIINFIAGAAAGNTQQQADRLSSRSLGLEMSLDALAKTSKLLTSVPSTMTADQYFSALAPQLLDLLDDQNIDNRRIASYIIGNGILGKRKIGSPGTIGWRLFAEPLLETLQPSIDKCPVPEKALKLAIDRLTSLVNYHPNLGLTKRLVVPILLPLWGLTCYALHHLRRSWADQVHTTLSTYMKLSASEAQLLLLSDSLLWDGPPTWTFRPGDSGGVEIRQRDTAMDQLGDMSTLVETIDERIEQYLSLVRAAVMTDEQLSRVFTHLSKRWLHGSKSSSGHERLDSDSSDLLGSLVSAKLAQRFLEEFKDQISSSLEGIFQLVEPIMSTFVLEHQNMTGQETEASTPGLRGLASIVGDDIRDDDQEDESTGTVSTALNLLSSVLASSDDIITSNDPVLLKIERALKYIAQASPLVDSSITASASNILILLQLRSDISEHYQTTKTAQITDIHADDRKKHCTALVHVSDELAPVRAQGLSALTNLISKRSPVLNIQSTSILLISLLQDEDEYIYLSAIKALGFLASNHPKTVVQSLLDRYSDPSEESALDVRIRLGEALNKTIRHLGQLFVGEIASIVGEQMIVIASRRGDRRETLRRRERAKQKLDKARKDAEEAWDGEIPTEGDDDDREKKLNAHIAKVVEGWADTGREEDIRIRTSALSILGTAIETNIAGLGANITSSAVDCVIAILKLEKNIQSAILRRSAVLVIMSLSKALDSAEECGLQLGFGFAGESLAEVITVLRYVELTDKDEIVVGHVKTVIENLNVWQQKSILGAAGRQGSQDSKYVLDQTRNAGLATRPMVRPRIAEID